VSDAEQSPNVRAWSGEAFLTDVTGWVEDVAADAGIALTGEREQPHLRSWSSAIRFGSEGGDLWFKVNGHGTRHEAGLLGVLAQLEPGLVPAVLAVDRGRAWTLMRDAGPVLRSVADPEGQWEIWPAVLGRYAEAQLRLADQPEAVLGTGVVLATPEVLPDRLRALVEAGRSHPTRVGSRRRADAAGECSPGDDWCADSRPGCPDSLSGLHSGNVCWGGSRDSAHHRLGRRVVGFRSRRCS
jgi:hypothetical protein